MSTRLAGSDGGAGRLTSEKDSGGSLQTLSLYSHPLVGSAPYREAARPSPADYSFLPALLLV